MASVEKLKDINFDPKNYNPHEWFIEQDDFNMCPMTDEPIDIPVVFISEYPLAHYKYSTNICCEKNIEEFYECLGTQPLKIVFTHNINEDYVKRHNFNIYPDTDLTREFSIDNNILYLDTNEVLLENDNNFTDDYEINKKNYQDISLREEDELKIKEGLNDTYSSDESDSDSNSETESNNNKDNEDNNEDNNSDDDLTEEEKILDLETGKLEELTI